ETCLGTCARGFLVALAMAASCGVAWVPASAVIGSPPIWAGSVVPGPGPFDPPILVRVRGIVVSEVNEPALLIPDVLPVHDHGVTGRDGDAPRSASSRKHLAVTVRRSRRVSRVLPLHGARGEAADVLVYEEGVDQSDRHRAEERARHERPPEVDVTLHELGDDADRDRLDV